jgi:hypothetical protein
VVVEGSNVGIGTAQPTHKLDVSGNARVTQNMLIGDAYQGRAMRLNDTPASNLYYQPNFTITGSLTSAGDIKTNQSFRGHNMFLSNVLTISGGVVTNTGTVNTTINGSLTVQGDAVVNSNISAVSVNTGDVISNRAVHGKAIRLGNTPESNVYYNPNLTVSGSITAGGDVKSGTTFRGPDMVLSGTASVGTLSTSNITHGSELTVTTNLLMGPGTTLTASNIVGASPVTISSSIVMAAGTTLTTAAIEPPAGAESNLKITGTITTSNIVANSGENLRINSTGAMIVPVGTTAQQPTTAYAGMLRFNSTLNKMEYYNNSSQWIPISLITTTGGNDVFIHNNYKIHVFTGGGNFILDGPPGRIDVLMVAGGGGGGTDNAGAGGAGGLIFKPDIDIQPGNYFISIGTGGTGAVVQGTTATAGGDTTAFGLTAKGGGYGNNGNTGDGSSNSGGSGGGGDGERNTSGGTETQSLQSGDSSTYGHGNDGGNYGGNSGGGGGGAGTAGANGDSVATGVGGVGGDGLYQVTIGSTTYNFATMFGTSYGDIITSQAWFAGGGAGGNDNSNTTDVAGGKGGGGTGKGANWTPGDRSIDGDANTGGGGAGATYSGSQDLPGGNGGSGIVIIRIHN